MPRLLRNLLRFEVIFCIAMAILLPSIDGAVSVASILLTLAPAILSIAVLLRVPVSYAALKAYCVALIGSFALYVALKAILQSMQIGPSGIAFFLETLVCAAILLQLGKKASRDWFEHRE